MFKVELNKEEMVERIISGGLRIRMSEDGVNQDLAGKIMVAQKWEGKPYDFINYIKFESEDGSVISVKADILLERMGYRILPDFEILD